MITIILRVRPNDSLKKQGNLFSIHPNQVHTSHYPPAHPFHGIEKQIIVPIWTHKPHEHWPPALPDSPDNHPYNDEAAQNNDDDCQKHIAGLCLMSLDLQECVWESTCWLYHSKRELMQRCLREKLWDRTA